MSQPVLGQAVKMGRKLPAGMDSIWNDKDTYFFIYVPWASYDDPNMFAITYRDCHFIYGQTFAGRYLLILVRVLRKDEVEHLGIETDLNVMKVITARDMDHKQRREYLKRRGN